MKAETGKFKVTGGGVKMTVKRGQESWTYLYITLALSLAFVWTVIQVWPDLWKVGGLFASTAVLVYLFLFNGQFVNWLIGLKSWYENRGF
jgi:archaellum biogenesis protein FlaJ (TadC family)